MRNLNTFEQTPELGFVSFTNMPGGGDVISGVNGAADVVANGTPVELIQNDTQALLVKKLSATTVKPFGFAIYNAKRNFYNKGDALEIAREGVIIYLTAKGAVAKGDRLKISDLIGGVEKADNDEDSFGYALDKGVANDLVRVQIKDSQGVAPVGP